MKKFFYNNIIMRIKYLRTLATVGSISFITGSVWSASDCVVHVYKGWNLLGNSMELLQTNLVGGDKVTIVWVWNNKDKKWEVFSVNPKIQNLIKKYNIPIATSIPMWNGYWIKATEDFDIDMCKLTDLTPPQIPSTQPTETNEQISQNESNNITETNEQNVSTVTENENIMYKLPTISSKKLLQFISKPFYVTLATNSDIGVYKCSIKDETLNCNKEFAKGIDNSDLADNIEVPISMNVQNFVANIGNEQLNILSGNDKFVILANQDAVLILTKNKPFFMQENSKDILNLLQGNWLDFYNYKWSCFNNGDKKGCYLYIPKTEDFDKYIIEGNEVILPEYNVKATINFISNNLITLNIPDDFKSKCKECSIYTAIPYCEMDKDGIKWCISLSIDKNMKTDEYLPSMEFLFKKNEMKNGECENDMQCENNENKNEMK